MIGEDNLVMMLQKLIKPNYYWMTLMQVLTPLYIYLAITSNAEWHYWLIAFVFYFLYLCIGNNIGLHRFFSHRYFEMPKPIEYFVAWCSTMSCLGSPLSYVCVHNIHHKSYDTELDPHGRFRGWKSLFYYYHKHLKPEDMVLSRNLINLTREYKYLNEYYWLIVAGFATVFYIIGGWNALLFGWLLPASLTLWATSIVLLLQHDDNGPSNTKSYMWFGFGETWHKNHHDNVALANHAPEGKIDVTYQISKLLSK